ncbi:MAG: NAD-dependent deacetylase [Treponema sp.]|nr:NAD-dependent deacetylase [Treponema sp.]
MGAEPEPGPGCNDVAELFRRICGARHLVALTGAGVSTLSGIRDFRGKDGLYGDSPGPQGQIDAEKIFSLDYFEKDPSLYYTGAGSFVYSVNEKEPSIVHTVLGELEERGLLKAVITQNIDMLHQKGGGKNVIEIHGSPTMHYCLRCPGIRVGFDEVASLVRRGEIPRCRRCGGALKPAITFFGESLPLDALRKATDESQKADLMLILGTSLTVYPAASMPEHTLRRGGSLAIVNNMPTPLDRHAAMRFAELEPVFEGLRNCLGRGVGE